MDNNSNVESIFVKINKEEREARIKELVDKYKKEVGTEEFWKRQPVDHIDAEAMSIAKSNFYHPMVIELVPYCRTNLKYWVWLMSNDIEALDDAIEACKGDIEHDDSIEIISDFECKQTLEDGSYFDVGFYPNCFKFLHVTKLDFQEQYKVDCLNLLNLLNYDSCAKYYIQGDELIIDMSKFIHADNLQIEDISQSIIDIMLSVHEERCGILALLAGRGVVEAIKVAGMIDASWDRLHDWKEVSVLNLDYDPDKEYLK